MAANQFSVSCTRRQSKVSPMEMIKSRIPDHGKEQKLIEKCKFVSTSNVSRLLGLIRIGTVNKPNRSGVVFVGEVSKGITKQIHKVEESREMVTKTEETQLNQLENQVENGGGGAWEYLCLVRKLKVRRSEKVLKHGSSILNDPKKRSALGPEEWTLNEQVAIAAMDCHCLDVAQNCIKTLQKKFPESKRVGRLEALLLEAKGLWGEAEEAYSSLLEDNPLDQAIHKRRVAISKALGKPSLAIELLNKYLELFMADHDAWRELAEVYLSLQMYKQAAFCYEELILSQPTVPLYHLAYADVLYTIGGVENLISARKYYAATIELTGGKSTRALLGICLCASAIAQLSKGRNKEDRDATAAPELHSLAAAAVEKEYKQKAPAKLQLISSALRSLKL